MLHVKEKEIKKISTALLFRILNKQEEMYDQLWVKLRPHFGSLWFKAVSDKIADKFS